MANQHQLSLFQRRLEASASLDNVTVVGTQWGDEGKGKIVDWLASGGAGCRFGAVVRFNGGHNAGHTLVAGGRTCRVSLVPSGVLTGTPGVIGPGVVVDPFVLLEEIGRLRQDGIDITSDRLHVAETVALVLPVHQAIDRRRDAGPGAIGTTGRGIGPACEDKVGRRAVRLCDVLDGEPGRQRLAALLAHHRAELGDDAAALLSAPDLWLRLQQAAEQLRPYLQPAGEQLNPVQAGRPVLFEGAQSVLLDIDHGTYPFVTASSCVPGSAAAGSGVPAADIGTVIGVAKAYVTRVGAGPIPTEDGGRLGRHLQQGGNEVGTNTGRVRRCGALDAVLLRQACRIAGVQHLALTKLDVLDGLPRIRIATGLLLNGERLERFPSRASEQARVEPVYEELDGWPGRVRDATAWESLPHEARRFVRRIEELVEIPGLGPVDRARPRVDADRSQDRVSVTAAHSERAAPIQRSRRDEPARL